MKNLVLQAILVMLIKMDIPFEQIYFMIENSDKDVFIITETWAIPGTFEKFKSYRKEILDILNPFEPEFIFYHPFDWAYDSEKDDFPRGMEVCRFKDEETSRKAINAINNSGIRKKEREVFYKIRSYIGRFAR